MKRNGSNGIDRQEDPAVTKLRRRMREAVREVDTEGEIEKLTADDVKKLRDAGFIELAEVAEIYVSG